MGVSKQSHCMYCSFSDTTADGKLRTIQLIVKSLVDKQLEDQPRYDVDF